MDGRAAPLTRVGGQPGSPCRFVGVQQVAAAAAPHQVLTLVLGADPAVRRVVGERDVHRVAALARMSRTSPRPSRSSSRSRRRSRAPVASGSGRASPIQRPCRRVPGSSSDARTPLSRAQLTRSPSRAPAVTFPSPCGADEVPFPEAPDGARHGAGRTSRHLPRGRAARLPPRAGAALDGDGAGVARREQEPGPGSGAGPTEAARQEPGAPRGSSPGGLARLPQGGVRAMLVRQPTEHVAGVLHRPPRLGSRSIIRCSAGSRYPARCGGVGGPEVMSWSTATGLLRFW